MLLLKCHIFGLIQNEQNQPHAEITELLLIELLFCFIKIHIYSFSSFKLNKEDEIYIKSNDL